MPQSLSKVILHIIFSTKNREPWLDSQVRPRMHAYLATICRDLGAQLVHVGGVSDHVHIVTTLQTACHFLFIHRFPRGPIYADQDLISGNLWNLRNLWTVFWQTLNRSRFLA